MAPRNISAKEVMIDIGAGLSNDEIGRKYRLSERMTRNLFDKLLSVNLLTIEEHCRRVGSPPHSTDRACDDQQEFIPASTEFIDVSKHGWNQWWRYLAGILFILLFLFFFTVIMIRAVGPAIHQGLDKTTGRFTGLDSLENYILQNLIFVFLLTAIFLVVRFEHKRPFLSLITRNQSIDWKKVGSSFGVFWALLSCELLLEYVAAPEDLHFRLNLDGFLSFLPAALILTPIQTAAEELLFRGYLLQMTALLTRNRVALVFISGVLFMAPHLANPEVASGFLPMALYYFGVGGFLTVVTLRSNSLEMAIGIHTAQNLFVYLVANYANSALKTESIFFISKLDAVGGLVSFCIMAVVFYVLMFDRNRALKIGKFFRRRY